jgi:hypothetical protein
MQPYIKMQKVCTQRYIVELYLPLQFLNRQQELLIIFFEQNIPSAMIHWNDLNIISIFLNIVCMQEKVCLANAHTEVS